MSMTLLEEGSMATQSSILSWRIPIDRGAWQVTVHEVAESDMTEGLHFTCKSPDYSSILIHHLHPVDKADVWLVISMIITVK